MKKLTIATIVLAFSGMSSATEWNRYATESVILHGHGHTATARHNQGAGCGCSQQVQYDSGCCTDQYPHHAHSLWNDYCAPKPCCEKKHFRLFRLHRHSCCESVCDPCACNPRPCNSCACDPCQCDPCGKRPILTFLRSLFHPNHFCGCGNSGCGTCFEGYATIQDAGVMSNESNKQVIPEAPEEAPEKTDTPMPKEPMTEEPMPKEPMPKEPMPKEPMPLPMDIKEPMNEAKPTDADKPIEAEKPAEAAPQPAKDATNDASASIRGFYPTELQRIGW